MRQNSTAFTFIECLAALAAIAIVVSGLYAGLTQINEQAIANRLYSNAIAIAQERIDSATVQSFDLSSNQIPTVLQTGSTTTVQAIYTDPTTLVSGTGGRVLVTGTVTAVVGDVTVQATTSSTTTLPIRRTSVSVDYTYRGRDYHVQMTGLRASDS